MIPKSVPNKTPKVTLLTNTNYPLETVYSVWEASKTLSALRTPQQIRDEVDPEDVRRIFRAVIRQGIPVGEHVDFVFMLEDVCIAFREQMIRHRIGTKASPERVGADIVMGQVPDLSDSSWWSQSMVIQDMGTYHDRDSWMVPESVREHEDSHELYRLMADCHQKIQSSYNQLVKSGVPMEDARLLIPLGAHHRISWKLNMTALMRIVSKRSCWVLQLGFWGPVIQGMISELAKKIDPIFHELVTPPCIKTGPGGEDEYTGCVLQEESRRRLSGEDQMPPCPLHLCNEATPESKRRQLPVLVPNKNYILNQKSEMLRKLPKYAQLWGRDPYTGERIEK